MFLRFVGSGKSDIKYVRKAKIKKTHRNLTTNSNIRCRKEIYIYYIENLFSTLQFPFEKSVSFREDFRMPCFFKLFLSFKYILSSRHC